ncbi:hypothetical protein CNE_BB1p06190 (plasmid) [Cupriavidus necator N-1]|jgi:hypothetical protein|uniref:HTH lysR-type domain-containing protein n=1 Tax=Cupriavidus necator (strain ATCC 43291 / DSM 13513 / CCUG 52238 / LMG 8453 / N-1) TaxID=1042878 RepID=F8GXG9_CUPNN
MRSERGVCRRPAPERLNVSDAHFAARPRGFATHESPPTLGASVDRAAFARVVEAGNFSVAARQLGRTPSTVSRQIKRLKKTLGVR